MGPAKPRRGYGRRSVTRHVVFIESNTSGTGELFARRALELDLAPTVIAADHSRYDFDSIDGVATITADTADVVGLTALVRRLSRRAGPIVAVMSTSDYFVGRAADVARRLGLASPDPDAIERCRDKTRQRGILAAAGVPSPEFRSATSMPDALVMARQLGYPVVCKPAVGSGSVGVRLCADPDELGEHVQRLLGSAVTERGAAVKREVLLEQFVAGDEYSIEIVGERIQAVVRKRLGAQPHFVEVGHDYPAQLPERAAQQLTRAACDAVRALALADGPTHVEARMGSAGVRIIEVNPRLAGGRIPVLVQRSGGADLIAATILTALGEPVAEPPDVTLHGALRFVVASGASVAGHVASQLVGDHGWWEAAMYVAPGTVVQQRQDFRDRVGHAIACCPSADEAEQAAASRAARLATTLIPTPPAAVRRAAERLARA
ncbi:MAG: hypothetical protein QOI48_1242 [Solirubrobacteraceae bacterium]|nr:hypothetical protein [Solirubrobacteraceae bacterium]